MNGKRITLFGGEMVRVLAGFIFFIAIGALLLSALGRYWAPFDILTHFSGHLFGIAAVAALAMFIPRFALGILIVGVLAVPLAHAGMSNLVYSKEAERENSTALRIKLVSLNIWSGHSDLERIGRFLENQEADIVVLVEYSAKTRALLPRLKPVYPYQYHCEKGCRIALLSKKKAIRTGAQPRTHSKPRLVWATYAYGTERITVVGTHLRKPIDSPARKAREIDWLANWLRGIPGPIVLAGDLNSTPWSYNFRKLVSEARLHRASGIYPTWPASFILPPQLAIDHVLASDGVTINRLRIGERVSSDHLPVLAELSLTGRRSAHLGRVAQ
ncbi:MAG: endonuclease/exonuclease/phosphatase family protein [Hyphomicrobiaceae bacterium]|nr:endonuclease/exonuclease/phosphatase family protein [Hyphomicrobiaceae bacterium]